jgi:hypothetical protein
MSGGDVRGNIRRGGACRLNSHVSYDLGRLGRTTGVHHGRGRIQYCNRLIGWDKRVCRNFQVMRLDLGPWNEPKLMRGNFAGITHGPSCGAARVANAIGYNIFTEILCCPVSGRSRARKCRGGTQLPKERKQTEEGLSRTKISKRD